MSSVLKQPFKILKIALKSYHPMPVNSDGALCAVLSEARVLTS